MATAAHYLLGLPWNVGFLLQYEVKNIPNFFIAVPTVAAASAGVWKERDIVLNHTPWPSGWSRAPSSASSSFC